MEQEMRMIRADAILKWTKMKHYQALSSSEYIDWDYQQESLSSSTTVCVSHRWISPSHPDPNGSQLHELQRRLPYFIEPGQSCAIFYDYCSMPQSPRTAEEEKIFEQDISSLNLLFQKSEKVIILSEGYN